MIDYAWNERFLSLFNHCLEQYERGNANFNSYYSEDDLSFLRGIGCKPRELFDFVEDHGTDLPASTALLVAAVRRSYFLQEQGGKPSRTEINPADLPPKPEAVAGIPWLPRIIAKARAKLRGEMHPDIMFGVGSVMDAPTAALYIASGADFVVSPVLNAEIARLCNRRKIPFSPGCGSLSEISQAEELGVEIVKIFPGSAVGGPGFVKAVRGPCPWTKLMPTGGVDATEESIKAWFQAGVACVGMGSKLISKERIAAGDYAAISATAAQVLAWIQQYKLS